MQHRACAKALTKVIPKPLEVPCVATRRARGGFDLDRDEVSLTDLNKEIDWDARSSNAANGLDGIYCRALAGCLRTMRRGGPGLG